MVWRISWRSIETKVKMSTSIKFSKSVTRLSSAARDWSWTSTMASTYLKQLFTLVMSVYMVLSRASLLSSFSNTIRLSTSVPSFPNKLAWCREFMVSLPILILLAATAWLMSGWATTQICQVPFWIYPTDREASLDPTSSSLTSWSTTTLSTRA